MNRHISHIFLSFLTHLRLFITVSQFQNGKKASHRRKPISRKELKIIDSAALYCVSGFRRNYNNRLLKLATVTKISN